MISMLSKRVEFSVVKRLTNFSVTRMHYWPVILLNVALHKNDRSDASLSSAELEKNKRI